MFNYLFFCAKIILIVICFVYPTNGNESRFNSIDEKIKK